jgi:Leucine-rich repeat (LRR) protein
MKELVDNLLKLKQLQQLSIIYNKYQDIKPLIQKLSNLKKLTHLNVQYYRDEIFVIDLDSPSGSVLDDNIMQDDDVKDFLKNLPDSLTHLNLSSNGIAEAGARILSANIPKNLIYLNLSSSLINDVGAKALSTSIRESNIEILDMRDNRISSEAMISDYIDRSFYLKTTKKEQDQLN